MLLASSFEEVLLLDSDSLPMQDPEVMFEDPHYKETGNYFFPELVEQQQPPSIVSSSVLVS